MKLFGHREHRYDDRAQRTVWVIPAGSWAEVPDEIGHMLLTLHGEKLCDVSGEGNPGAHTCAKTPVTGSYPDTAVSPAPATTTLLSGRLSPQRRKLLKEAQHRSGIARRATRGKGGENARTGKAE